MVFYDTENLHAIHHKGDPRHGTLIQFSAAILEQGKQPLWAKAFFARWKGDAILITPRGKDYFPPALMAPVLSAFPALTHPVIVMGSSMGGYGALKYSAKLGADAVIAFAPQFSVSPHEAPFDPGRHGFYNAELHGDMAIKPEDISGEVALFYDPEVNWDTLHTQAIVEAIKSAKVVAARHGGHELIELFKTEPALAGAVARTLQGSPQALQQHCTDHKKRFVNYYINLTILLIKKKQLGRARRVLDAAFLRFNRTRVLLFCEARLLRAEGEVQAAFDVFSEGLDLHKFEPDFEQLILGGELASAAGEGEKALELFRRAARNSFIRPMAHFRYLREFIKQERWEEGLSAAEVSMRQFPNNKELLGCVHEMEIKSGRLKVASVVQPVAQPVPSGFIVRVGRKVRRFVKVIKQR